MFDIYNVTKTALDRLGYTVKEQGTFASGAILPESFVTYQIIGSPSGSYADGLPTSITHHVQISLYSKRPAIVHAAEKNIVDAMLEAGFMRGDGRGLPFDQLTEHYGYTCDYKIYDSEV